MAEELRKEEFDWIFALSFFLSLIFVALIILGIIYHLQLWDEYSNAVIDISFVLIGIGLSLSILLVLIIRRARRMKKLD